MTWGSEGVHLFVVYTSSTQAAIALWCSLTGVDNVRAVSNDLNICRIGSPQAMTVACCCRVKMSGWPSVRPSSFTHLVLPSLCTLLEIFPYMRRSYSWLCCTDYFSDGRFAILLVGRQERRPAGCKKSSFSNFHRKFILGSWRTHLS